MHKVFTHPVNEVIFKYTLDELMEEVWSYQPVYICTREMLGDG